MWVEPELLNSGGDVTRGAGERVRGGATNLSAASIGSTIFGDFPAARSFHQRLSAHRDNQVSTMDHNHRRLDDIGQKAKTASSLFSETEERNRSALDTVTDA
ncbi:MAG TPA: DUF2563 family protein [Mycobacterium sp.]|nr:DUF2563 family protein [Mycobacterium sp.]